MLAVLIGTIILSIFPWLVLALPNMMY